MIEIFCIIVFVVEMLVTGSLEKRQSRYVDQLEAQLTSPADQALYRRLYKAKEPRKIGIAGFLAIFCTPTVAYIYQRKWALAAIAFLTFQGLLIWWVISIFTMPFEVCARNKFLADQAFNDLLLARQ